MYKDVPEKLHLAPPLLKRVVDIFKTNHGNQFPGLSAALVEYSSLLYEAKDFTGATLAAREAMNLRTKM
jgi:hypothetical protein